MEILLLCMALCSMNALFSGAFRKCFKSGDSRFMNVSKGGSFVQSSLYEGAAKRRRVGCVIRERIDAWDFRQLPGLYTPGVRLDYICGAERSRYLDQVRLY